MSDNKMVKTPVHVNWLKFAWARHLHCPKNEEKPMCHDAGTAPIAPDDLPTDSYESSESESEHKPDPNTDRNTRTASDANNLGKHSDQSSGPINKGTPSQLNTPDEDAQEGAMNPSNAQQAPSQPTDTHSEDSEQENPAQEYVVRRIIRGRYKKGHPEFLIDWQGYMAKDRTWEPWVNLNETAKRYIQKHPVRMSGRPPRPLSHNP